MKTVLITGASKGIGKAIAKCFEGKYHVIQPTREELDLLNTQSIERFIEKNKDREFDIIINNAGINDIHEIEEITDEEIHIMMQTNLIAPIKLVRGFVKNMKEKRYGRIVNIGSIWAVVSKEGRCVYSATKNGIHGVTNSLAVELGRYNILVNTVCPGYTETELTKKNNSREMMEKIEEQIPLGRMAQPKEIAELVYFLCSENNTYITGQKITIDGGFSVK